MWLPLLRFRGRKDVIGILGNEDSRGSRCPIFLRKQKILSQIVNAKKQSGTHLNCCGLHSTFIHILVLVPLKLFESTMGDDRLDLLPAYAVRECIL
jgi:hypothetical protein